MRGFFLEDLGGMLDSWEFNKIAGGVLSALLVAFGTGTLADIMHGHGGKAAKPGYVLPVTDGGGGAATAAAAPVAFSFATVAPLLKTGSADNGRAVFAACRSCHTVDKGGKALVGPNLWGVVGKQAATSEGFPRYSNALKGVKAAWTYDKLAAYLNDPRTAVPGNQMAFAGVKSTSDLADLLLYLRTLSDSPVALPN